VDRGWEAKDPIRWEIVQKKENARKHLESNVHYHRDNIKSTKPNFLTGLKQVYGNGRYRIFILG